MSEKETQVEQPAEEEEVVENIEQPEVNEMEELKAQAEEYKRKWYAVSAEYENYRKRNQAAVSAAFAEGKAEAIKKLLPVADNFMYAYEGASDEKTKQGIDKIIKSFNTILASMGVEEIPLAVGDEFSEDVAEAIMNMPAAEGEKVGTIKQILKKGYRQDGKVIRFAQVIVIIE